MSDLVELLPFVYDDGGRVRAGFRGLTGDCAVRAIAIGTGQQYLDVYRMLAREMRANPHLCRPGRTTPRRGVPLPLIRWHLQHELGWTWEAKMRPGTGCQVHLRAGEVPAYGPVICRLSKHIVAVVDSTIYDIGDPSRDGTRCIYGWWVPPPHWRGAQR